MRLDGRRESGNVIDRRGQSAGGGFSAGGGGGMNILALLLQLFMRRRSGSNVTGGGKGGCLSIVLIAVVIMAVSSMMGGGCTDILGSMMGGGLMPGYSEATEQTTSGSTYQATPEEEELASFAKKILAGTEDVWTEQFQKIGKHYEAPHLVLFKDAVRSGCGSASSSTGPFYCSADQTVYLDLSFFSSMKRQIGADGDFAYAYVIAHEVGHHVQ